MCPGSLGVRAPHSDLMIRGGFLGYVGSGCFWRLIFNRMGRGVLC